MAVWRSAIFEWPGFALHSHPPLLQFVDTPIFGLNVNSALFQLDHRTHERSGTIGNSELTKNSDQHGRLPLPYIARRRKGVSRCDGSHELDGVLASRVNPPAPSSWV